MQVKATREGLTGRRTATGYMVESHVPFVALPSAAALHLWLKVSNPMVIDPSTGTFQACRALVLDIGPWNRDDDAYVFGGLRPQAETGIDKQGRKTNGAGIDLGARVWYELRMVDNGPVIWSFE